MLMSISLAEKLGPQNNLIALSAHPGAVEGTNLGSFCDWEVDYPALSKIFRAQETTYTWINC